MGENLVNAWLMTTIAVWLVLSLEEPREPSVVVKRISHHQCFFKNRRTNELNIM
jgi:hypothetical protein